MKNQFIKITQGVFEVFKGPRTKDFEYDQMAQEYTLAKERLINIRSLISSYPSKLEGYKSTLDGLISNFEVVFKGVQGMYEKFINDATTKHKALNEKLTNMFARIEGMKEEMEKWTKDCATVDEKMKIREDKRKLFDHYDEKMGDLYEERQKIFAKGREPNEKEDEKFSRNIKKYQEAANDYFAATNDAYKFICLFLDQRYETVTIGLAEFIDNEKTFFFEAANIFSYFNNIKVNVLAIKQNYKPPVRNYDAGNYIRGKGLLNISVEDLAKDKTKIEGVIPGKNDPSKTQNNNNFGKSYTFNGTSQNSAFNSSQNQNTPFMNNNQNNMQNQNFNNNNNNQFILNPYTKDFNNNNTNTPQSNFNFYSSNINNSVPDPFGNNNQSIIPNNSYMDKNAPPPTESKNPYSRGFSGENPFDKPNI